MSFTTFHALQIDLQWLVSMRKVKDLSHAVASRYRWKTRPIDVYLRPPLKDELIDHLLQGPSTRVKLTERQSLADLEEWKRDSSRYGRTKVYGNWSLNYFFSVSLSTGSYISMPRFQKNPQRSSGCLYQAAMKRLSTHVNSNRLSSPNPHIGSWKVTSLLSSKESLRKAHKYDTA